MADVVISGSIGRDVFSPPIPKEEVTEETLRTFREKFEYELTYEAGLSSDIAIALDRPTKLRVNEQHEDAWKISMSELNRRLDKAIALFVSDRVLPEQAVVKPSTMKGVKRTR